MKGTLLKILSVLAFSAVVFPFLFGCDVNRYGNIDALRILYYYGVGAAVFGLGYLGAEIKKAHPKLSIPIRAFGLITFGAGFAALIIGGDASTVFALGVCSIFAFFIGERCRFKNFADMFPLSAFAVYIVLTLGCYIFVSITAPEKINAQASDTITASFVIEFTAAALLLNQSGIFDRANMRKETKTSLPKGLTGYNAALVLGVTVTGLLLCIFRKQIAWVLEQAVIILIRAFVAFASLFTAERMEIVTGTNEGIGRGFIEMSEESYLLQALGILVLVVIVIRLRKHIFKAIKDFFGYLGSLLAGRVEESARPEFKDVFENYSSRNSRREQNDNIYAVKRRYRSETDPVTKYRLGYRVLLYRIKSVNQRLSPADTTSVQAERGSSFFGREPLSTVAQTYDSVRYGSLSPAQQELSALSDLIEKQ
ncbi:MAG: hypothetical protein II820_02965 [Ruminiclostridium sp.]|nr:hypothetical protein [Ruminiclostridium sp.]